MNSEASQGNAPEKPFVKRTKGISGSRYSWKKQEMDGKCNDKSCVSPAEFRIDMR